MFKQIILILLLSIGMVFGMTYAQQGVQLLISGHDWISQVLTDVFSGGQAGNVARELIALLSIPVLVGLIPAVIYWLVKRHWMPFFMEIVWVLWLIQAGALAVMFKAPVVG